MAMRSETQPHYKWVEIQPRHFKALAKSLPDPQLWPAMLELAQLMPQAIASVKKRLPADFKESAWTAITKGVAKKAEEFLRVAEKLHD